MPSVIIQSAGMLTTVQDKGRYGYQRYGMPIAGAMDVFSLRLANALVGNDTNAACLEATFTGPEIHFTGDGAIALTGADMGPAVNGVPVPVNKTLKVKRGDTLSFSGLKNGFRTYIAFAGGINIPAIMGSRSTYLRASLGGFAGRALQAGDELPLGEITGNIRETVIPEALIPRYQSGQILNFISGPEVSRFTMEGIHSFLTSEYRITEKSDRMGYRLAGKAIAHTEAGPDIISSGISRGTVQVPGNGQPIILMADRQSSGGYTRIACVISADLTLVAQMKPGDNIRFREITIDRAQELFLERDKLLRNL